MLATSAFMRILAEHGVSSLFPSRPPAGAVLDVTTFMDTPAGLPSDREASSWAGIHETGDRLEEELFSNTFSSSASNLQRTRLSMFEQEFNWMIGVMKSGKKNSGTLTTQQRMLFVIWNMFERPLVLCQQDFMDMTAGDFGNFLDETFCNACRSGMENDPLKMEMSHGNIRQGVVTEHADAPAFIYCPLFADSSQWLDSVPLFAYSPVPFLRMFFDMYRILDMLGFSPLELKNPERPPYWSGDILGKYFTWLMDEKRLDMLPPLPILRWFVAGNSPPCGVLRIPAHIFLNHPVFTRTQQFLPSKYGTFRYFPTLKPGGTETRIERNSIGSVFHRYVEKLLDRTHEIANPRQTRATGNDGITPGWGIPDSKATTFDQFADRMVHVLRPQFQIVRTEFPDADDKAARSLKVWEHFSQPNRLNPNLAFRTSPAGDVVAILTDDVPSGESDDDRVDDLQGEYNTISKPLRNTARPVASNE